MAKAAALNLGGPVRIAGLREKPKPSRGMPIILSILPLPFSSWTSNKLYSPGGRRKSTRPAALAFKTLANRMAALAGYPGFEADACLINRYAPGARMTLHQDKNEVDYGAPIVSVSLGLPAVFELGGLERGEPVQTVLLHHGDVLVWGGPARLRYHGVRAVPHGNHPLTGACRINLTFRQAA